MQIANMIDGANGQLVLVQKIVTLAPQARPDRRLADRLLGPVAVLLRDRPSIVIASTDSSLVAALFYRLLRRCSRLVIWSDGVASPWRWLRRVSLRLADGVLVRGEPDASTAASLRGTDAAVFDVRGPYETSVYLDGAATRATSDAFRLVVRSPLTPPSGVLRMLDGVARAAERVPSMPIELHWIGDGDLRGVLAAQPLPDNLDQHFHGDLGRVDAACLYARSGVLIAPFLPDDSGLFEMTAAEAMASGLVVLFDHSHPAAGHVLSAGETGIAFDGLHREGLPLALLSVLSRSVDQLNMMRIAARRHALEMSPQGYAERLARAVESVARTAPSSVGTSPRMSRPSVLEAD